MAVWWRWRRSRRRRGRSGDRRNGFTGSISLLIAGDEEGPAVNGTAKVLDWMMAKGEIPDRRLVGEPTNREALGELARIGAVAAIDRRLLDLYFAEPPCPV